MRLVWRRPVLGVGVTACAWLMAATIVGGQAAPPAPLAEQVFKNVQVLKGITVNEFLGTMGVFSAALGMSCEDCHNADDSKGWAGYAEDNPRKQMARVMVTMMATINRTNFRNRQLVTCYSCHRGQDRPKVSPALDNIYAFPPADEPLDVITQVKTSPTADEVFEKYFKAIGGTQRLAALTSFTATGTRVGYGPESETSPFQIFARSPAQRTTVIQTTNGNSISTFDGTRGWLSAPFRPVDVLEVTGQELEGMKFAAAVAFPGGVKQMASQWRVGRATVIGEREAYVVQGTGASGALASLMFDTEDGMLLRSIFYADSPVGRLPVQFDYSDYRDVAGVKMPFKYTMTWLDGRDFIELKEIRPNTPIDAARFARPPAPPPPKK